MTYTNRDKGKVIERWFAKLIRPLFPNVQRNAGEQSRSGGCDLVNTPGFSFEIKGGHAYTFAGVQKMIDQVKGEATPNTYRVVMVKPHKIDPYVILPFDDFYKLLLTTVVPEQSSGPKDEDSL